MLGIRHFQGFAIDLWQGEITTFLTDMLLLSQNAAEAGPFPARELLVVAEVNSAQVRSTLDIWRENAKFEQLRHLTIVPAATAQPEEILRTIQESLNRSPWIKSSALARKRITLAVEDAKSYRSLFAALEQVFPEH